MTPNAEPLPQLQADRISYAPNLFRSLKPKKHERQETGPTILQDLSFAVFPGDRIAVVGAAGAGKTTLLRLLNRLSEPTTGKLYFHGQAASTLPAVQWRQQVVLILQESKLLNQTVQDAIAYPLRLRGMGQKEITHRVGTWMERLRIPADWRDRTEQQLSVGQRQLVSIARALAIEPPILLCDEPTAALDVGRSQQVLDLFRELSQTQQTTCIMVNHQLDLAQQFATRLFHLQNGALIADQSCQSVDWVALAHQIKHAQQEQDAEWQ